MDVEPLDDPKIWIEKQRKFLPINSWNYHRAWWRGFVITMSCPEDAQNMFHFTWPYEASEVTPF
jgi:hypothetical protein